MHQIKTTKVFCNLSLEHRGLCLTGPLWLLQVAALLLWLPLNFKSLLHEELTLPTYVHLVMAKASVENIKKKKDKSASWVWYLSSSFNWCLYHEGPLNLIALCSIISALIRFWFTSYFHLLLHFLCLNNVSCSLSLLHILQEKLFRKCWRKGLDSLQLNMFPCACPGGRYCNISLLKCKSIFCCLNWLVLV